VLVKHRKPESIVVVSSNTDPTGLLVHAKICPPPDFPKNTVYRWALKSTKLSIETYLDILRICPSKIMPPRVGMLLESRVLAGTRSTVDVVLGVFRVPCTRYVSYQRVQYKYLVRSTGLLQSPVFHAVMPLPS
jgi:hypothetical protein